MDIGQIISFCILAFMAILYYIFNHKTDTKYDLKGRIIGTVVYSCNNVGGYYIIAEFEVNGKIYRSVAESYPVSKEVGNKVTILYDPRDPCESKIEEEIK